MIKNFLLTLFFIFFISTAHASDFCNGFNNGFITGWKMARNSNMKPFLPFCPMKPMKGFGDPKSDYEHGYIIGYNKGSRS